MSRTRARKNAELRHVTSTRLHTRATRHSNAPQLIVGGARYAIQPTTHTPPTRSRLTSSFFPMPCCVLYRHSSSSFFSSFSSSYIYSAIRSIQPPIAQTRQRKKKKNSPHVCPRARTQRRQHGPSSQIPRYGRCARSSNTPECLHFQ